LLVNYDNIFIPNAFSNLTFLNFYAISYCIFFLLYSPMEGHWLHLIKNRQIRKCFKYSYRASYGVHYATPLVEESISEKCYIISDLGLENVTGLCENVYLVSL